MHYNIDNENREAYGYPTEDQNINDGNEKKSFLKYRIGCWGVLLFILLCTLVPDFLVFDAMMQEKRSDEKCTLSVKAKVVDIRSKVEVREDDDGTYEVTVYTPVYSFVLENDEEIQAITDTWREKAVRSVGEKADILVDPHDPTHIRDPKNKSYYVHIMLIMLIGPLIYVIVVFVIRKNIKDNNKEK